MAVRVETTTDSVEDVKRSVGEAVEVTETEKNDETQSDDSKGAKKTGDDKAGSEKTADKAADGKKAAAAKKDDKTEDTEEHEDADDKGDDADDEADAGDKSKKQDEPETQRPKRKNKYRRRIDRLERDLEAEKERVRQLESHLTRGPKTGEAAEDDDKGGKKVERTYSGIPRPRKEDFADSEDPEGDYAEARARWGTKEEIAKAEFERQSREGNAESQRVLEAYKERVKDAKKLIPDFDAAFEDLEDDQQVTPAMQYVMFTSPIGPFIAHYLATHPKEAAKLAKMDGADAIREMGKLEVRVQASVDDLRKKAKGKKTLKSETKSGKRVEEEDLDDEDDDDRDDDDLDDEEDEKADEPVQKAPPKKISTAPKPINKVKDTGGGGPKTLKDIAGSEDRLVDHVKFDKQYERTRKEQRSGRA